MSTLMSAINASASALDAQRARMEVAVSNLANAESTRGADGQPYRRRDVVLETDAVRSDDGGAPTCRPPACEVAAVVEDQTEFRQRYEPSHPDADADGFVVRAERRRARRNGRHARRGARLSGQPAPRSASFATRFSGRWSSRSKPWRLIGITGSARRPARPPRRCSATARPAATRGRLRRRARQARSTSVEGPSGEANEAVGHMLDGTATCTKR